MTEALRKPFLPPGRADLAERSLKSLSRAAIAIALGARHGRSDPASFAKHWHDDDALTLITRAATTPTSTDNTAGLANVAPAFLASLVPFSAAADLFARSLSLKFNGAGTISLPSITPPLASFVREGAPIPVRKAATNAGPVLSPFKLAVLVGLTNEVLHNSEAEKLVSRALVESVGPALDAALFSNDPGDPDLRPPGIFFGATVVPPTAGGGDAAMTKDLQALVTAIAPVAGNGGVCIVAAPAQAVAIGLRVANFPYPLLVGNLPPGTVAAVAVNALVSANADAPKIEAGRESVLHESDPADEIATAGGVLAAPTGSVFQTDSVSLRLIMPVAWMMRDPKGAAWVENVTW